MEIESEDSHSSTRCLLGKYLGHVFSFFSFSASFSESTWLDDLAFTFDHREIGFNQSLTYAECCSRSHERIFFRKDWSFDDEERSAYVRDWLRLIFR
jgi:hypothetical protein